MLVNTSLPWKSARPGRNSAGAPAASPDPARRGQGLVITLLTVLPFALVFGVDWVRHWQMAHWDAAQTVPTFTGLASGLSTIGLVALGGAILVIRKLRLAPDTTVDLLILVIAAWFVIAALVVRNTVTIADGAVLIRPAEPWRPDIRFRLAEATVAQRGCATSRGRHGAHHHAIFTLRLPGDPDATIDLGRDVDPGNAARWSAALRAYANGALRLSPASAQGVAHDPSCLDHVTRDLGPAQTALVRRLLE